MRVTEGTLRMGTLRKLTGIAAASLLALSALGGNVLAGNTSKLVYLGSGPFPAASFGFPDNYSLSFTPVSGGSATSVYVTIQNKSGGTLNRVILEGGNQAPGADENANFVPDGTNGSPLICSPITGGGFDCIDSLPAGFSYVAAYAPSGHPCTIYDSAVVPAPTTGPGRGISCDVGQLASGASVTFRFALQVPAYSPTASNAYQAWFTASGNEGTSNQGSNQDAFFALGTVNVEQAGCKSSNFFTGGSVDIGATCDQPSTLTGGNFLNGAFAQVNVYSNSLCLPGYKCFGKRVDANVEFGAPVQGGLQWTVMWQKSSLTGTPKGFIHFLDTYIAGTSSTAYEFINFKTTAQCPATITPTTTLPCLNGKPGFTTVSGISYFRAVFTTFGNGSGRGF